MAETINANNPLTEAATTIDFFIGKVFGWGSLDVISLIASVKGSQLIFIAINSQNKK